MTLISFIVAYLVGGFTLIPLIIFLIWYLSAKAPETEEEIQESEKRQDEIEDSKNGLPEGYGRLRANEYHYKSDLNVQTTHSDWLTVTQELYPLPQVHPNLFKSNGSYNDQTSDLANANGFIQKGQDSTTSNDESNTSKELNQVRKKNRFYAVLRHGNLFLYKDSDIDNVQHVIVLSNYMVTLWPRNLEDAKLFTKQTAICLLKKDVRRPGSSSGPNTLSSKELKFLLHKGSKKMALPAGSYFLYGDTNELKEDWYFSLLRATTDPTTSENDPDKDLNPYFFAQPLFFYTKDIIDLIQTTYSTENQLNTMWLNAIIGRLFLSVYKTKAFNIAIRKKVEEKLRKIRTPGFLDELRVGHLNVGNSAPFITCPKLRQLSPDGTLEAEFVVDYSGRMSVAIATKVVLNLGSHFKQREFDVNLQVTLAELHGKMILHIKPPPSNRIWYCFTSMPQMNLHIEPVVSSRSINYNLVTNTIEKKFKEAIKTSLVYPFMDDLVFFNSSKEVFRGGIWDHRYQKHATMKSSKNKEESEDKKTSDSDNSEKSVSKKDSVDISQPEEKQVTPSTQKDPSVKSFSGPTNFQNEVTYSRSDDEDEGDFSHAATQIKNGVTSSVFKIKKWYNKKTSNTGKQLSSSQGSSMSNAGPQMISSRRKREPESPQSTENSEVKSQHDVTDTPQSASSAMFFSDKIRQTVPMNEDTALTYGERNTYGYHKESWATNEATDHQVSLADSDGKSHNSTEAPIHTQVEVSSVTSDINSISATSQVHRRRKEPPPPLPPRRYKSDLKKKKLPPPKTES